MNILKIKKNDGTPFKVFTPFWRNAEKFYLDKNSYKEKKVFKCKKKISFFQNTIKTKEIYPKKNGQTNLKKFGHLVKNANKELKLFINERIKNYSEARNFPNKIGTSKLSPFIKHGQIHVETIWEECIKLKNKGISKFLAEIGWREFNHSLINNFPYMLKKITQKNLINFLGKKIRNFYLHGKKG